MTAADCAYVAARCCRFRDNDFSVFSDAVPGAWPLTLENCAFENNGFPSPV